MLRISRAIGIAARLILTHEAELPVTADGPGGAAATLLTGGRAAVHLIGSSASARGGDRGLG